MKTVALWVLLVLCLAVMGYAVFLGVTNAARQVDSNQFMVYPWQQGFYRGYWVLAAAVGSGMLVVPCIKGLLWVTRELRLRGWKVAAKAARRAAAEQAKQGGRQNDGQSGGT